MSEDAGRLRALATARIAEIGPRFDLEVLEQTRALYAPHLDLSLPAGAQTRSDIAYGEAPRQRLDLYLAPPGAPGPTLVYVPGGGFTGGDKAAYRNLGTYFARNGISTVVVNYRLAPTDPWPAGPQDVGLALRWTAEHFADHGRPLGPIVLFGQSAGATHSAGYLFGQAGAVEGAAPVALAVLMNGFYEMTAAHQAAPNLIQYFGADPALYPQRSPINQVGESRVPVALLVAEYDPPMLAAPSLELAARLCRRDGKCPRLAWLAGHNHVSPVLGIGTPADDVGPIILEMIAAASPA